VRINFFLCHACVKIKIVFGCPQCSLRTELSNGVHFPKTCVRLEFFFKREVLIQHSVNFRAGICFNNKITATCLAVLEIRSLYVSGNRSEVSESLGVLPFYVPLVDGISLC
jgi:hypothetical protein